jgi:hypothetical protein
VELLNSIISNNETKSTNGSPLSRITSFLGTILFTKNCDFTIPCKKKKFKKADTYSTLEYLYSNTLPSSILSTIIALLVPTQSTGKSSKAKKSGKVNGKEVEKVVKQAVADLVKTRKAVYLEILNGFLEAGIFEDSWGIFEVFKVLDDKVGYKLIYLIERNFDW